MAQAQRDRGDSAQRPEEAVRVAEQVLRGLAQPQAGGPTTALSAIQTAERSVVDARSAADEIVRRMGLREEQSRDQTIANLEQMRERFLRMGAQSVGDPELDRRHQDFVRGLLAPIDTSLTQLRSQRAARLTDEEVTSVGTSSQAVQGRVRVLEDVIRGQRLLTESGSPEAIRRHVDRALELHDRGETDRARMLAQDIPREYSSRARFLASEAGAADRQSLGGFVGRLADTDRRMTADDVGAARTEFTQILGQIDTHRSSALETEMRALEAQRVTLEQLLARQSSEVVKEQIRRIIDATDQMLSRMRDPAHASPVSDEELRRISRRILGAQEMVADLERAPAQIRPQLGRVYAAGLDMLGSGGSYENFDAVMLAASEIKRVGSGTRAASSYRSDLVSRAEALRDATTEDARGAAQRSLNGRIATYMGAELQTEAARVSRAASVEIAAPITQMASALQQNPEQATTEFLQRSRMALEVGRRMTDAISPAHSLSVEAKGAVLTIYARALTSLATGTGGLDSVMPQVTAQMGLADAYARNGVSDERRQAILGMSQNLAEHPENLQRVQLYLQTDATLQQLGGQRSSLPPGSPARAALDAVIGELEGALGRMERGENLADQSRIEQVVTAVRQRMATDPQIAEQVRTLTAQLQRQNPELNREQAEAQAINMAATQIANASEEQRLQELIGTATSMTRLLGGIRSGAQRADVGELFRSAVDAIIGRNTDDGTAFRQAAETYARLTTDRDRADLMAICRQAAQAQTEPGARRFTAPQLQAMTVYRQRAEYESAITDQALLRNARAYFDLALIAARGQDPGQFQSVLDLAVLYGRMASVPEAQLTTAQRQQRTEAMAFVSQHLGNFSSIPRIAAGSRVLDIGAEGTRGWTLPATVQATPITDALLRGRSVYETLGGGNPEQGITALRDITTATARHTLNADDIGFERRAAGILGRTDRDVQRAQSRYGREAERLQGLERAAQERGDSALADYYRRQAQMCNYGFLTETISAARQIHGSGRQDIESAMAMADEARQASGASEELMRRRIGELTTDSPQDTRTGITQMLQLTEMNPQQMADLARQVIPQLPQEMRQGFIDRIRAAGRDAEALRGVFLEMLMTQLSVQAPGDAGAVMRQRIEQARGNTASMRRLFIEQIYTQVLSSAAEQRMGRGRERQQQAGRIMDGLTQFDRSVQTIDTRSRESGRLELFVGIRSLIALANNRDVNMLGEFVGADGRVVQRVEDAGALSGERREVAQAQAEVGIRIGTALIEEQVQIQRVRNQVVASAARDVRDRNVTEAQTMIGRMIDLAPADQQQALRQRLTTALARAEGENETTFRQRQAREMQAIIRDAASASGVSITRTLPDGASADAYDVERGYGDYRRVVGLAYSENFQGAQWELGRASARITSSSVRLGNRINQRELDIAWQSLMNAPDAPSFLGELDRLRGLAANASSQGLVLGDAGGLQIDVSPSRPIMEELLSRLPPDRRAELEGRLLNQEQLLEAMPDGQRTGYAERLRLTQYQTDPEGARRKILTEMAYSPAGEGRRRRFLTELANESVPDPSQISLPYAQRRSVPLMSVGSRSTTTYYNSGAFETRLDEVDRMIEGGNIRGAQGGLGSVTRDMNAAYYAQRRDTHRMTDLVTAARLEREQAGIRDEFVEGAPVGTEDHPVELARERGTREDRNEAVTALTSTSSGGNRESVVGAMENSYQRGIEDQYAAARASGAARDEIIANAGNPGIANPGLVVDRALVGRVIDQLPDEERQAFLTRLNSDPRLAGQIYTEISGSHPDAIRQAASLPEFAGVRSQLLADAEVTGARGRTAQRRTAWTFARLNIREGLNQLRMADMAQTSRDVSSDRTRAARDELDRVKGRAGQIYRTPAAHREMAARRFEMALTMLDERNDYQAYDVLMSNQPITARVYEHRGSRTREWYSLYSHGTDRLYVTAWNHTTDDGTRVSLMDSRGRRHGRSIAPVDELRAMNWVEMRELASYTDSDLFYDSRARIRPHLESMADQATDLQLAQVGIRRDSYVGGPGEEDYGYRLVRWQPTQQDLQRLAVLQQEFSQMRADLQGSIFGFDSPWGDDPQLAYVARLDERMGHIRNAGLAVMGGNRAGSYDYNAELRDSAPYLTHVVEGGELRARREGETRTDSDQATRDARASMTNWQSGYRVTVAVGEFVVATAGVVLAPVTGGASLVLTVGVGALGVHRGFEMRAQAGEWTGEAMFSVGMGAATMILAPLGYMASGGRFLGSAGTLASEMGTAARAAPTIGRFGRMVQVIEGTSGLSTEAAMAQTTVRQLATRFILGAPELGMGARGVHLAGAAMAFGGAGQFAYQMPRMMRAVERGEMAWFEAAWGGFQAFMQPLVQARAAQRFAARSVQGAGIPEYVPRWRQFAQGMWTGNPMLDAHTHAIARDYHVISQQRSQLSDTALRSYDTHMQRFGIGIDPAAEARILTQYNQAELSGQVRNFQEFLARTPEARITFLEAVRNAHVETVGNPEYQGPRIEARDLTEAGLTYVRARRRGASEADALAEVDAHATEARVPAVRSAEDMYTQVRRGQRRAEDLSLPMQAYISAREHGRSPARAYEAYQAARPGARARADEMRARTDRAALDARAREQRTALGTDLNGQFTRMEGDNFILGTGEHAATVTAEHANLAGDLVFNAESILRRPPGESLQGATENARTRIREQLIREGREGPEADRIADERMARVMEMVRNPQFRSATLSPGGADRAAQLAIGLRDAGYLPEIGSQPAVMRATNLLEAQAIARNQDLTPADLDHFAIQRSGWAEERVAQAEALEVEARGVESFDPARAASARERAQRLRNEAEAIEASADMLHGAAAIRREGARAEGMRSRASQLEAQARWEPQRAAELQAQAQALRADADRIAPPVQPQGARVRSGPADVTRLQVDMDLTIAVRADAESYLGTAQPGVEMRPGEAPRDTYIIGGRQQTPEQARDASRSAAVADLIVSRRAQGTTITDEQIPGILRDLGLPQSLAPSVRSLTNNGEFVLAVGLGNREAGLRIAAGQETPQALSPASVRRAIEIADTAVPQEAEPLNQAAVQRRMAADSLDQIAQREMARAAQLEQSDPQASSGASARAGSYLRLAAELRASARRLSEQARALAPTPVPQTRVAPTLVPPVEQPRTRTPTSVVDASHPETIYSGDPVAQVIIRRGGAPGQQAEWLIGGERIRQGGVEQQVDTGRILRTIEDYTVTMARAGQESDVITISGDKRRLNQLNQMLGMENGDLALSAYREIMHRAVTRASEEGLPFLIRPSQSGDEVIGVIIVRPGDGPAVRERLARILDEVTSQVFNERMSPSHPESLAHLTSTVRNPRDLVSAAIEVGQPVQVRRGTGGDVTARHMDGTDAMITRPDGRREFLPAMVRATDDPHFAPGLRQRTGVTPDTQITPGLEPVERTRVQSAWERRGQSLNAADRALVDAVQAEIRTRGLDATRPDDVRAAIDAVTSARVRIEPTEVIATRSAAFEIRLEVTDPAVLADARGLLAETGKGLAEVLNNTFGLRGLNTFLGHYGANAVVNRVEAAVGAYAQQHGLSIRRLGTMKYIIEGGTPDQVAALHQFVNTQLQQAGLGFRVSGRSQTTVVEPGTTGEAALSHVSNGHLVVERRTDPSRTSDWNGETRRYQDANALISAMAIGHDQALRTLLGDRYEAMRPVIDLVRSRADIRNFEDLVFALRDSAIGGPNGRTLEGAFRSFVVDEGPAFRGRLGQVAPRPAVREAAAVPLRVAVGAEEQGVAPLRPVRPAPLELVRETHMPAHAEGVPRLSVGRVESGPLRMETVLPRSEFSALHPPETQGNAVLPDGRVVPVYHNQQHTENVFDATVQLARARGLREDQAQFLGQIALLHDADPTREPGRPARASATLAWLDSAEGRVYTREHFGWGDREVTMAMAVIQRSEFPFDSARVGQPTSLGFPRGRTPVYGTDRQPAGGRQRFLSDQALDALPDYYAQQSPVDRYRSLLQNMSPEDRRFILGEAPVFSEYSDKSSWYFGDIREAARSVDGLSTEAGRDMTAGTRGFLDAIGRRPAEGRPGSFDTDIVIAREFGVEVRPPYLDEVLPLLRPEQRANWEGIRRITGLAEAYSRGDQLTPQRAGELGINTAERQLLDSMRSRGLNLQQATEEIVTFVAGSRPSETVQAIEARLGTQALTSTPGVRVEGALGSQHADVQSVARTAIRLAESDTPLESIPAEYRQMVEQLRMIIPEERRIVELNEVAGELNAEAERLASVNSEDPRVPELRASALELRGEANRRREETPSSVHVTVEGARGIVEPRVVASLEAATRGVPGVIADDAAMILRAARGMDLTSEQASRMMSLPEEIIQRMTTNLTAAEAVAIARSLHPDGGGPQGGGRTPPRDNVIPLRPSQPQAEQTPTRTVAQNPAEIAAAILRGETVSVPQAAREQVGFEIASQHGLTSDTRALARFARDVVRGDAEASRILNSIPPGHPARIAVESLVNSRRFRNNAATDSAFDSYIGTAQRHGQGWAQAETARGNILRAMPDAAERAVASEAGRPPVIEVQQPPVQLRPVPQIVEAGVEPVVAMANQPPGGPPRGGPPQSPRGTIIIGGDLPQGGAVPVPRRRTTQSPPTHGIQQADLEGRGVTYSGLSDPDPAGRSFHLFDYRGQTIAVPEGLGGADIVRYLERGIVQNHENVERMLALHSQPSNPEVTTVATERGASERVIGTMTALDQMAQVGTAPGSRRPLERIAPEYRDSVRRIREAYDLAPQQQRNRAAAQEIHRQAASVLSSRDQRIVPSSAQARELVALVEGRLLREPRAGESIAAEGLIGDRNFQEAMARGDRDTAYRIAEGYGQMADAAERVIAPPALVEAQRTRMRAEYDSDPQVRAAIDQAAAQRGIPPSQYINESARTSVIISEGRRIAREAQFQGALTSRSVSFDGDRRVETITFGGARTGLPEARYTGEQYGRAVSAATDAERVLTGEIRLDQVPADRRPAVERLLSDGSFVAETRVAAETGNRRTQLAMALERERMGDLFVRYADPAQRASITDPTDVRAMQHISRELSAGRNLDDVIGETAGIAFDARRFATMTPGSARTDFDRLMVDAVMQESARRGADRQGVAFEIARDVRAYGEQLSRMRGPQSDRLDRFALEVSAGTAQGRGSAGPDMSDFQYAAMVRATMVRMGNDMLPGGNQGVMAGSQGSLDILITTDMPGLSYRVRVTESGATIEGATTGPIFGRERPPGDPLAAAFLRYANSRVTFDAAFGEVRQQLARGNIGEAARIAANERIGPQGGGPPPVPQTAYAGMDQATVLTTLQNSSTSPQLRQRAFRSFAAMERARQDAVISEMHRQGRHNEANQLVELQAMNGRTGARMEQAFGLRPGALSDIYISAPNITEARVRLAHALGIGLETLPWAGMPVAQRDWVSPSHRHLDHLAQDGFLFGMLTSGDMPGAVSELFPGGRIESIAFQNGLVGAYRVRVVDANGETHTLFVKRQDLRPDRNGAEYSRAAGIPAADVMVSRSDGSALQYTMPDGSSSRYGILRSIGDYEGTLRMAGRDIQVRTVEARSLGEIMANPDLMGQFVNDPATFWRELGSTLAGSYATGIYDRHEGNVWAMRLELVNPSTQDIAALNAAGYQVSGPDAQGRYTMFRIGGIDTDSGGTFLAQVSATGPGFDLTGMDSRFGSVDLHRLFVNLTRIRNEAERVQATAQGRAPRYISVMDLAQQAFGQAGNGPLMSGLQRWTSEFGNNPQFRADMRARFASHDGDSCGMGVPLQPADHVRLANEGITYLGGSFNGELNTPVMYADGRSIFRSRYDAVWTDGWPQQVVDMFPQNTEVFIVPLAALPQTRINSITGSVPNFTWTGGSPMAVYTSRAQIPPDLAARAIPATRHGNVIRAGPGLRAAGVPSYEFGATPVFDYILSDPARMGRHFDSIYRNIMTAERDAHVVIGGPDAAAQQRYLQERVPQDAVGNINIWPTFDRPF